MKRFTILLFIVLFLPLPSYALNTERILEEINDERISAGLAPLVQNNKLSLAALNKATALTFLRELKHTQSLEGVPWSFIEDAGYLYDNAGENLAVNFKTESEIISDWMRSASHRANILRPDFKEIGISIVDGSYQGGNASYVVTYFAKPNTDNVPSFNADQQSQIKALTELINLLLSLLRTLETEQL